MNRLVSIVLAGVLTLLMPVRPIAGRTAQGLVEAGPWQAPVAGHRPIAQGEHPRLLFRRSDLPVLRRKAASPEGQAILRRLRLLLDGGDGETMTALFNPAGIAYSGQTEELPIGALTIGHVAGYGLLYQLTGDRKYAEFGRQSFEKALAGVRDRDDRYSYRKPGGALRAGPSLGWLAVGYDLCYDGWDAPTREKLGRAISEYAEEVPRNKGTAVLTLDELAAGTMPPFSNHFGMQVGGAALALLAVSQESWIDQARIDKLLGVVEHSLVRNIAEGFGDGGFFAEGDGTGSMASQIAYLSALQAWRNVMGRDFIGSPRPNARMLTLKWIYQTVYREGKPDFWPIRGGYPHNVWSRGGLSGAGYFAFGFAGVTPVERGAMKWVYRRFLAEADLRQGTPFDTASLYPHIAVAAFVNWPAEMGERDPAQVLPHCYRDEKHGFYCWRDRWRDANDTVITVLTKEAKGYMGAKPEATLSLNTRGRHLTWGSVVAGPTRYWSASPRGETSSLTLADGTCFGVDFTSASGADIMLVTTGKAEGQSVQLGSATLTFYFPTTGNPPAARVEGDAVHIGKQRVRFKDGNLVFAGNAR